MDFENIGRLRLARPEVNINVVYLLKLENIL